MAHFIPSKDGEKKYTDLVKILFKEVWRFHGLPSNIMSDWDSRFTSAFWSSLVEALDIRLKMSSPFHHSTIKRMGKRTESTKHWNVICRITAISSRIIGPRCYQWQSMPTTTLSLPLREYHRALQTLDSIHERVRSSKQKQRIRHPGTTFTRCPAFMHSAVKD
jgi:hypothetical protein